VQCAHGSSAVLPKVASKGSFTTCN